VKPRKVSEEERQFAAWVEDAIKADLVIECIEQPKTFEIVPKAEIDVGGKKKKFLFHPHRYTPDFYVKLSDTGINMLSDAFSPACYAPHWKHGQLWIDTKGTFTIQHGQSQMFAANRKLVWNQLQIYISKVIPWASQCDRQGFAKDKPKKCLFVETFCPSEYCYSRFGKPTAMSKSCKTIEEFIQTKKNLF
jgi:hypothetical protein